MHKRHLPWLESEDVARNNPVQTSLFLLLTLKASQSHG